MTNELKPCPFAKLDEKHHIDVIETHPGYGYIYCRNCDFDFPSEESIPLDVLIERWNTRAERTCKPNIFMDEQITESTQRWLGECECGAILGEGTDEYAVSLCFPHYCPCCGAKVVSE